MNGILVRLNLRWSEARNNNDCQYYQTIEILQLVKSFRTIFCRIKWRKLMFLLFSLFLSIVCIRILFQYETMKEIFHTHSWLYLRISLCVIGIVNSLSIEKKLYIYLFETNLLQITLATMNYKTHNNNCFWFTILI